MHVDYEELYDWQAIDVFKKIVSKRWNEVKNSESRQRRYNGLREGWVFSAVADHLGAQEARLCSEDPPDVEVKLLEGEYRIEVTEALPMGRRPGHEARYGLVSGPAPIEKWVDEENQLLPALVEAFKRKELKSYSHVDIIVVYANLANYPRDASPSVKVAIQNIVDDPARKHMRVVLWRNFIFCTAGLTTAPATPAPGRQA
ncbi:hypothetical protein ABEG18_02655 [Alsobacter sp. KACC 23698]|uniref:Uncharacterized protein n=1 Tax=Alsobacter sp. KACC 23698 TaxID=3149229 RepID=A0AAU7JH23_9HYPH